jgi:hypothetical protein
VNGGIFLTRSALRTLENSLPRQAIGVVVTLPNKKKKIAYINIKIYKKKRRRSLAVVVGLAGLTFVGGWLPGGFK